MALPSLVLVLGISLAAVQAAAAHLACVDAARVGARALARGDTDTTVLALIENVAPERAEAELAEDAGFARVVVSSPVEIGPGIGDLYRVTGEAVVPLESRH